MELQTICFISTPSCAKSPCSLPISNILSDLAAILLATVVLPTNAFAATPASQDVSYISGGVGLSERKEFHDKAADYNLRLSFAQQKTGTYLAKVKVSIKDMLDAPVIEEISDGPLFYAKLPPDNYQIRVEYRGKALERKVDLTTAKQQEVVFYWPE